MARNLTAEEHQRVTEAIRAAESRTSGEIYCVVARSSDSYFFPAISLVLAFILTGSLVVALVLRKRFSAFTSVATGRNSGGCA